MALTREQETLRQGCLKSLYELLSWLEHWGAPLSRREERAYYDVLSKIEDKKMVLKQFLGQLKLRIEKFTFEYHQEPFINESVGQHFMLMSKALLDLLEGFGKAFPEEQPVVDEMRKIILHGMKKSTNG